MTILDCYQYVQDRLNALSTNYGDNIPKHTFVRTFNAAQTVWVESRSKINNTNSLREDELQQISISLPLTPTKKEGYWETSTPKDYYHFRRAVALTPCEVFLYRKNEEEVNRLLSDDNWKPSLDWKESFLTITGNKIRVYGDFSISSIDFLYYRTPRLVNMADGYTDNQGNLNVDIDPEFQESSLIEILNDTVTILSSDNGDSFRYQTSAQRAQNS
jgi:hypothetical protein